MWNLIKMGGVVSMLFILVIGLIGLGAAFYFALRPNGRSLGFIRGMALATLFGTFAATCADVGATLEAASSSMSGEDKTPGGTRGGPPPTEAEALPRAIHFVLEGLSESTSPGVLGFPLIALMAMLTGVGRRRLDGRSDVVPRAD